jgi:predicted extracellular nuclease
MELLPENERYSYVYQGNSQVLDQALVSGNVWDAMSPEYDVVHVNAEFKHGEQVSDHDPAVVGLTPP